MTGLKSILLLLMSLTVFYSLIFFIFGLEVLVGIFIVMFIVGVIGLIGARYGVKQEELVVLRGVNLDYAMSTTRHAMLQAVDSTFAFPSGHFVFVPEEQTGDPTEFVVSEKKYPMNYELIGAIFFIPWMITGIIISIFDEDSSPLVWLGLQAARAVASLYVFMFLVLPILMALLIELVLKQFLLAKISAKATAFENEVHLVFTFQGISALMARAQMMQAFRRPELPARFKTESMLQQQEVKALS